MVGQESSPCKPSLLPILVEVFFIFHDGVRKMLVVTPVGPRKRVTKEESAYQEAVVLTDCS